MFVYLNNQFVSAEKALVPTTDRGLKFGDGVFETIAVYDGIAYQFASHLKRLTQGLRDLKIKFSTRNLDRICNALIQKNKISNGFVRILITRGSGGEGYLPTAKANPTLIIESQLREKYFKNPVKIGVSRYNKISPLSLPVRNKLLGNLNSVLVKLEARENKWFDAILINDKGEICETSSGNIFWLKNKILYTPSLECGILSGTTREAILRISPLKIKEGKYKLTHLEKADEVFISNVSWQILPVKKIAETSFTYSGFTATKRLQTLLTEDIKSYVVLQKKRKAAK